MFCSEPFTDAPLLPENQDSDKNCCDNERRGRFGVKISEEAKIREELAREIEKELEREILEGIFSLIRRLSDSKARRILEGRAFQSVDM
ncbi:hypothetical protein AMTR_s00040p00036020 [Amborella trichopoda]|uniref:Uncharacterized protein n=1 Tax=Amborella trichopoda TaxID=13333 RepID=W1PXJ3_AMBTC|nr:hypothetical protein AMTR_s00040p00036020 [Amborella trichopoda]